MQTHGHTSSIVVDLSDSAKEAALYFDYVVPLSIKKGISSQAMDAILPDRLKVQTAGKDVADEYLNVLKQFMMVGLAIREADAVVQEEMIRRYWEYTDCLLDKFQLRATPLLVPTSSDSKLQGDKNENLLVTLSQLPLIDTDKVSWEQIIEFRRDCDSVARLRQLRAFLQTNYKGKEKAFILDDLQSRLDQYANTVRDWGFETKTSTISTLLSSTTLLGTAGGTLVSLFAGAPTLAAVTASAGTLVELGKISLHIANRKYGLVKLRRDHPLAYIISAREQLASHD